MVGAREWLNMHPRTTTTVGCILVVVLIVAIVAEVRGMHHRYPSGLPDSYFTADDGKTFFAASMSNIPPFDHDGQQAVEADVFKCGNKLFVGYMVRFTPKYHDLVVAHGLTAEATHYGQEYKRPGDSKWTPGTDLRAIAQLTDVHCPDGQPGEPEAVEP